MVCHAWVNGAVRVGQGNSRYLSLAWRQEQQKNDTRLHQPCDGQGFSVHSRYRRIYCTTRKLAKRKTDICNNNGAVRPLDCSFDPDPYLQLTPDNTPIQHHRSQLYACPTPNQNSFTTIQMLFHQLRPMQESTCRSRRGRS